MKSSVKVPSLAFLSEVEKLFSVSYPQAFKDFCEKYSTLNLANTYPNITNGHFICDIETLKKINIRVGEEQWHDYERAIAGKTHFKNGLKLWGDILPIYYNEIDIFGYLYNEPDNYSIQVWSVHCIVHSYNDLDTWLKDCL